MEIFEVRHVNAESFEQCLSEDVVLVQFFNSFLSLPSFPQQLLYNILTNCFEEFKNTLADDVNRNAKKPATLKQKFDYLKTTINERSTKIAYHVRVLEKEKGLQWVVQNRLPLFLKSEKYVDYKLVKKLYKAQVEFLHLLLDECHVTRSNSTKESHVQCSLRAKLTEMKSMNEWKSIFQRTGDSFANIRSDDSPVYEVLWYTDRMQDNKEIADVTYSDHQCFRNFLDETSDSFPISLLYNEGLTAFKEFVCETAGEKHLMLWLQLEQCKYLDDCCQQRMLDHIKERYFRVGAPFQLSSDFSKRINIHDVSTVSMITLYASQDKILEPVVKHWCYHFTVHQYQQKWQQFKTLSNVTNTNVPVKNFYLRPVSRKHGNWTKDMMSTTSYQNEWCDNKSIDSDSGIFSEDGNDTGITRKKLRSKSAYPRLISSKLARNTNAGSRQIQLVSSFLNNDGFGFKPPALKYYHNDGSDVEHKKSVRLFIQPVPPFDTTASTVTNKPTFRKEDELDENLEFEKHLDALVDVLLHERHSGNFFFDFLNQQQNQTWLNCYHFWVALQEYNEYFFAESFSPTLVQRKANMIYSTFVLNNGQHDIQYPRHMQTKIYKQLNPPFEDLFDQAEQHALTVLVQPWLHLTMKEKQHYGTFIVTEEHLKYIEVNNTCNYKYMFDDEEFSFETEEDDDDDESEDKISPEEIEMSLPVIADNLDFDSLIRNKSELEYFQTFLQTSHKQGIQDLSAWTDMEVFRRLPRGTSDELIETRDKKATEIREKWLNKTYFFGANSPATKSGLKKLLQMCGDVKEIPTRPPSPTINEAQKYSRARVERRLLVSFKQTKEYVERKTQRHSVTELVEDLLMKKKVQRSEHAWKLLNSRWNSNSRDVTALRTALANPDECEQFRRFIKTQSEMMENNLNFWLEVQKYKDFCHDHVEDSIIKNKLTAIINVYVKSDVPPELQIDIPLEVAERIYEKACGRYQQHGPYLFREAQTTVFRIMYNYWKEFVEFRAQAVEQQKSRSQLLSELEQQHRLGVNKKKMLAEKRRLNKIVVEKRKRENFSVERERRVKPQQDLFSVMANTINAPETELEYDVINFSFSKQQAENELKMLKEKMEVQGIPWDDVDSQKSTMSGFTGKPLKSALGSDLTSAVFATTQRASPIKPPSFKTGAANKGKNPIHQRMSYFNTTGALMLRKQSLGAAYDRNEELRDMKSIQKTFKELETRSKVTLRSRNPSGSRYDGDGDDDSERSGTTRLTGSKLKMNKTIYSKHQGKHATKHHDHWSCVSDLPDISTRPDDLNNNKNSTKNSEKMLTRKSLKEFEKTPEGKPLKLSPLQYVESVNRTQDIPRVTYDLTKKEEKLRKSRMRNVIKVNPRLPHNAGTAYIHARIFRERPREESPPPFIEADVIVY